MNYYYIRYINNKNTCKKLKSLKSKENVNNHNIILDFVFPYQFFYIYAVIFLYFIKIVKIKVNKFLVHFTTVNSIFNKI